MTAEDQSRRPSAPLRGGSTQVWLQRGLVLLWSHVVPLLLAGMVLRFLVPRTGTGIRGAVALLGSSPLLLGIVLYFLFAALLRYWRFRIPGGRYASALPAHLAPAERDPDKLAAWAAEAELHETLAAPAMRRRLEQSLDPDKRSEVDARLSDLRAGLEAGDAEGARPAAAALAAAARGPLAARRRREFAMTAGAAACAALAAVVLRERVVQPYRVLSASMLPTLEPEDLVAGKPLARSAGSASVARRGDIIAFQSSSVALPLGVVAPEILVKRVIGLPGDRVSMKGGQPIINGWPVPRCDAGEYVFLQPVSQGGTVHGRLRVEFLDDAAYLTVDATGAPFRDTYECKSDEVFVLGDNRGNSLDSRAWNAGRGGGVPVLAIQAGIPWFLAGTHRNGEIDLGRFAHAVDGLQVRLRVEGMDGQSLRDGIARCLANRPAETRPPPPGEAAGARATREVDL